MPDVVYFDGTTTSIDLSQTGEKTVATISTSLPAGANGIIVAIHLDSTSVTGVVGTFMIKRDTTVLSQQQQAMEIPYLGANTMRRSIFLIAYDSNAPNNPTYTVVLNISLSGSGSINAEVKAIIINNTPMAFIDGGAVTISAGGSATLVSLSTSLPAGRYAAVAAVQWWLPSGQSAIYDGLYSYIYLGSSLVDSCPYGVGTTGTSAPQYTANLYYNANVSANASWSVRGSNSSSSSVNAEAKLLVFKVGTGWYSSCSDVVLDTADYTICQVTTEALANDKIGVIAFNTYRLRSGASAYTIANAGYQKLQMNNSTTDQQVNDLPIYADCYSCAGEHPYIAFLKTFVPTTNRPSFQVKNRATSSAYAYGQAKLLAFSFIEYTTKQVTDSLTGSEVKISRATKDYSTISEKIGRSFSFVESSILHEAIARSFILRDYSSITDLSLVYKIVRDSPLLEEFALSFLVGMDSSTLLESINRELTQLDLSRLIETRNIYFPYLDWAELSEIALKIMMSRDASSLSDEVHFKEFNIYDKARTFDTRECLKYRILNIVLSDIGRRALIKSDHHNLRVDSLILTTNIAISKLKSMKR